jgi:hypothetical protein
MAGFSVVSALRWSDRGELVATAVPAGGKPPAVHGGYRGDLRLFRCQQGGGWQQVSRGHAYEPVCLPTGGYAVYGGAGLVFLGDDGTVVREVKVGRFNWAAPSLSVGPTGRHIAWVRWRGDNKKLCVEGVRPGRSQRFRPSLYRYAWLDERTVLYLLGDGPRLLDLDAGKTRRFGPGLLQQARRGVTGAPKALRRLAGLPDDQLWEMYGDMQVVGEDVWFTATLVPRAAGPGAWPALHRPRGRPAADGDRGRRLGPGSRGSLRCSTVASSSGSPPMRTRLSSRAATPRSARWRSSSMRGGIPCQAVANPTSDSTNCRDDCGCRY